MTLLPTRRAVSRRKLGNAAEGPGVEFYTRTGHAQARLRNILGNLT